MTSNSERYIPSDEQLPETELPDLAGNSESDVESAVSLSSAVELKVVENSPTAAFDRLTPIRCFNYETQLCVAARLITESIEAGTASLLILDKNAEEALYQLETMGFSLRQAVLDRQVDIYYYRHGVRDRTFFKNDYQGIFAEFLKQRFEPVKKVAMVEFDTLFSNSVKDAATNQIEDFCEVARGYEVDVWGLYSPPSWSQDDFLSERLPESLGQGRIKQAKLKGGPGKIELSVRSSSNRNA